MFKRRNCRWLMGAVAALALVQAVPVSQAQDVDLSDYPTVTRADYVFACMAVNGQNRDALERCSCSIDIIASILPHERYVQAETVLRTLKVGGEKVAAFRASARHKKMVEDLRRAQAEADVVCF